MYRGFHKMNPNLCGIAALFVLTFSSAQAGNYQPMHGSFRPPLLGGTSTKQSGFRQDNSQLITAPSQQQTWTPQSSGSSPDYHLPATQPAQQPAYQAPVQQAPVYPQQQYYYGSSYPLLYGYTAPQIQLPAQQPAYQPPIQQAPVYPQQQYNYGSSYPQPGTL